jgi:LysM repeat protein
MKHFFVYQHDNNNVVIPAEAGIQKTNTWIPFCMGMTGLLVIFLSGCATYDTTARTATQEREDLLLLREDVNKCKSRLETMEIEQQKIMADIQQLRSKSSDEATRAKLDEMERRIAALDAARANDRKEIIEQISANVAKMMAGAPTPKTSPKTTPKATSSSSATATGYEHIVKEGETLSAIAAAYKVKSAVIIEANDLKQPYLLRKGQKLFIPQQ